ncbi:MAG: UDP-N-acetylmuramoyl-tripeptide--D-alanyl-D-alanine ligase [Actinobacteria bacterium]|nr:UDP-N-acetylmuramoyl-tripeptide--D-alanyl-D-alanine ligase [Actinomycetota bacterium]
MIPLTLAEIAGLVGGTQHDSADQPALVTGGVEFDSRRVGPGALFVALPGDRVDGHDFAAAAVASGAVGVLATRPVGVPAVVVPDVLTGLAELARAVLTALPAITVVGVTGSAGKTSTKDLLAGLLGRLGPTVAPPGSFNNELGLPYTVLRASTATRYLVLENSARGLGHIAQLCRIAPPRIAVVLNVGSAHLGEFGSKEVVAAAKGELVEAVPEDGVVVLNADDPRVVAMASRTRARVVWFGQDADVAATDIVLDDRGRPSYTLRTPVGSAPVRLRLHGLHQVPNSLAAAAVAGQLGLPVPQIAAELSAATPASRWRMEVTERADGALIVNDAYNANPDSMRAALAALRAMAAGRRWAVLGPMAELGPDAEVEHHALGRYAAGLGVDRLVVVGDAATGIVAGAGGSATQVVWLPDADAAVELLATELRAGDVVLVKASRSAGLERVALELVADVAVEGRA